MTTTEDATTRIRFAAEDLHSAQVALIRKATRENTHAVHVAQARLAAARRDAVIETTTRTEWLVTGDPGHGYPPYSFVFGGPLEGGDHGAPPEDRARAFIAGIASKWPSYRLEQRTITESPWSVVEQSDG